MSNRRTARPAAGSRREELRRRQQAELRAQQRRKRLGLGAGIVAVVVVAALAVWLVPTLRDRGGATQAVPPHANADKSGIVVNPGKAKAGAPTLVVYEDYQCPICKQFHAAFNAKVLAAADAGRITLEYRTLTFLDDNLGNDASERAAVGAACADDAGVYRQYHDAVFDAQPAQEGAGYPQSVLRDTIPAQVGLSGDGLTGFQRCVDTSAPRAFVDGVNADGGRAQVTGTPTYKLDGRDITQQLDPRNPASIDAVLPA